MILEKLKYQTQPLHTQLEDNERLRLLTSPALTASAYAQIIRKFYGYFSPLEEQLNHLTDLPRHLPDFKERRKAAALLLDLQRLGEDTAPATLPLCTDLPPVNSLHQAFGCIYVMEGSTLGGRIISKHLHHTLGLLAETGAGFFNGYGEQTGARWKSFREAVAAFHNQWPDEEEMVQSANLTFQKLNTWFSSEHE